MIDEVTVSCKLESIPIIFPKKSTIPKKLPKNPPTNPDNLSPSVTSSAALPKDSAMPAVSNAAISPSIVVNTHPTIGKTPTNFLTTLNITSKSVMLDRNFPNPEAPSEIVDPIVLITSKTFPKASPMVSINFIIPSGIMFLSFDKVPPSSKIPASGSAGGIY